MKLSLRLANGAKIPMDEVTLPLHTVAVYKDMTALTEVYVQLTKENLGEVSVMQDEQVIEQLSGVMLDGMQAVNNGDGTMTAHFYFSGVVETSYADDYVQAAKILLGEEE